MLTPKLADSTRLLHRKTLLPTLQLLTGVLTACASLFGWAWWWVFAVPWLVVCFAGILLAIPVVAFALLMAGVSGVEWRTPWFFVGWFIGAPTLLSLLFALVWTRWKGKRAAYQRLNTSPPRR